ncbi:MAG: ATP-binding protein [Prevotella sp.]|nr:ATP-binding protein [Prevotella sp.]
MSTYKQSIPQADTLMGSMRHMGYSFESAIADVIDNSISAKCSFVKLFFPSEPTDELVVGILDDGEGMTSDVLFEAMRYGCTDSELERELSDLGRFGLGMKSASLSQCRILTVVSKKDDELSSYSWDFNYVKQSKKWEVKELRGKEINELPHVKSLKELPHGTLVLWQDFDVLEKSSGGMVYDALVELKDSVANNIALIFHNFLSAKGKEQIKMYVNKGKIKPMDPFLESHPKTTTKKVRSIAIRDSKGKERQIWVRPYILPFATDLNDEHRKLIGGIETLRVKQGFYVYRNKRLIIWGTWFGMKPRGELTKNARVRVDIPNTLDDIWSIDIKKQTATIPKQIQRQLRQTVTEAMDTSIRQQTHRGRKENVDDIDYIWDRMEGRDKTFYYQINRENKVFQMIRERMSEEDYILLEMLLKEIEQNVPTQQIYIDKSNDAISQEEPDNRVDEVFQLGVYMVSLAKSFGKKSIPEIVSDLMKTEPFCKYKAIEEKLLENYKDEIK